MRLVRNNLHVAESLGNWYRFSNINIAEYYYLENKISASPNITIKLKRYQAKKLQSNLDFENFFPFLL